MSTTATTTAARLSVVQRPKYIIYPMNINWRNKRELGPSTWKGKYRGQDVVLHKAPPPREPLQEDRVWKTIRHLVKLKHDNVAQVVGYYHAKGYPSVTRDFCARGPLFRYVQDRPELTAKNKWEMVKQAAAGLEYLHTNGVVHGNLKGDNILVDASEKVKLVDAVCWSTPFSTATADDNELWGWLAPEQLEVAQPLDAISAKADVHALGLCIVQIITGAVPWAQRRGTLSTRHGWVSGPNEHPFTTPQLDLIRRMCAQDPSDRPNMDEVVLALKSIIEWFDTRQPSHLDLEDGIRTLDTIFSPEETHITREPRSFHNVGRTVLNRIADIHRPEYLNPELTSWLSLILGHFRDYVDAREEQCRIARAFSIRSRLQEFFHLHHEINTLVENRVETSCHLPVDAAVHQWFGVWEEHNDSRVEAMMEELRSICEVFRGSSDDEENHQEIMACCDFELRHRAGRYSTVQHEYLKDGTHEIYRNKELVLQQWFTPRYELQGVFNELGSGSFASVYRALWTNSEVAVKFQNEVILHDGQPMTIAEKKESMIKEANIWFRLLFPHVVKLFGACHVNRIFFVSEFSSLGSLDKYLDKHRELGRHEIWTLLHQAALGLRHLHDQGIAHGDLKCNNILVGKNGVAKLADFGLSYSRDREDNERLAVGALPWKAPERIVRTDERLPAGHSLRSDIFSLGICIVEALAGSAPMGRVLDSAIKFHAKHKTPLRCPHGITADEWELLGQMCNPSPSERPDITTVIQRMARFTRIG